MRGAQLAILLAIAPAAACGGSDIDAGGSGIDAGVGDDPLAIDDEVAAGSLDQIHREIVSQRCSGQPGLCHNGQFEPNLSTPALFYDYMVRRPALEKPDRLRVEPGDPDASFLVDKLRNRDVGTQMPLGAEPLAEEEIALIEAWIENGALRRAGDDEAPVLNNPPRAPEIGVFNAAGERLDGGGPIPVAAGTTLTLRHSVSDFETPDEEIAFGAFVVSAGDGRQLVLSPGGDDPGVGPSAPDPDGPMGSGDLLNRQLSVTIGADVDLVDEAGTIETVPSTGLSFGILALYVDEPEQGIVSFATSPATLEVE
ncbi:MAG TPA: hypothetical protein VK698_28700 [Kofleriaceae bacterium]|nr:hypothetical protein [Kofleriaceae bacterium]